MKSLLTGLSKALLLSLAVLLFTPLNPIYAQDEAGLSISPVVFELNANPGDTITNQIKLYNPTEYPLSVEMIAEDFTPVGEEGKVVLSEAEDNSTFSIASWTTISPASFIIKPEEQVIVSYTIVVPQNGEPGGHYGSIVASLSGGTQEVSGSSVASKRGALVLLRIAGNVEEKIRVNTFETDSFSEYGPIDFSLKFENVGNVHVRPAGFITITDMFGKQVAEIELPQNNVIPTAIRQADVTWEEENLIGKYTATVVANYGSASKQVVTDVVTFTVFPWKTVLLYAVGILLLIAILFKLRHRLVKAFKVLLGQGV